MLREEEVVGIQVGILGEVVEGVFEAALEASEALLEGEDDGREDFASPGTRIGLRAETHFPGDDRGARWWRTAERGA